MKARSLPGGAFPASIALATCPALPVVTIVVMGLNPEVTVIVVGV